MKWIDHLLIDRDLTRAEIGRKLEISRHYVSMILSRKRKGNEYRTAIARVLGVSAYELFRKGTEEDQALKK